MTHQSCTDWYNEARKELENRQNWEQSIERAVNKLKRAGVEYICLADKIGDVEILFDDKLRRP